MLQSQNIASALNIALKEIINSRDEEKIAVVGLPCHIQGLRKAMAKDSKLRDRIVLCLGLFCNHSPNFLATHFLLESNKINENDIIRLDYRGEGWPGHLKIAMKKNFHFP